MLARGKHRHSYGLLTWQHTTESAALSLLKEAEFRSVAVSACTDVQRCSVDG